MAVPQIALIHAENVLKAHEIILGHLEVGEKCRTKQILLLAMCGNGLQSLSPVLQRGLNVTVSSKSIISNTQ